MSRRIVLAVAALAALVFIPAGAGLASTTWSSVETLPGTTGQKDSVAVVGADDGGAIGVAVLDVNGTPTVTVTRSADGGNSWQQVSATLSSSDAANPVATKLNDGTLVAAWDEGAVTRVVRVSQSVDNGLTWSPAVTVSTATGSDSAVGPMIAALGAHGLAIAWAQENNGNFRVTTRSTPDRAMWSQSTFLSAAGESTEGATDIAVNANGDYAVGWSSWNGGTPGWQTQYAFSGAWNAPVTVGGGRTNFPPYLALSADHNDNFVVAFVEPQFGSTSIQTLAYSQSATPVSGPLSVGNSGFVQPMDMVMTSTGTLVLVWQSSDTNNSNLRVSTFDGSSWSTGQQITSNDSSNLQGVGFAQLTVGANGTLALSWPTNLAGGNGAQAQASFSTDGGATWSAMSNVSSFTSSTKRVNLAPLAATGFVFGWADWNGSVQTNTQFLRVYGWTPIAPAPTTSPTADSTLAATGTDFAAGIGILALVVVVGFASVLVAGRSRRA